MKTADGNWYVMIRGAHLAAGSRIDGMTVDSLPGYSREHQAILVEIGKDYKNYHAIPMTKIIDSYKDSLREKNLEHVIGHIFPKNAQKGQNPFYRL